MTDKANVFPVSVGACFPEQVNDVHVRHIPIHDGDVIDFFPIEKHSVPNAANLSKCRADGGWPGYATDKPVIL